MHPINLQNLTSYWYVFKSIQMKDLKSLLYGKGVYVAVFFSFLVGAIIIGGYLRIVDQYSISVMAQPLYLPLFVCVLIDSIYLALASLLSISREKDRGTLETLFYGPINHSVYIFGKFLAHLIVYILMILVSAIFIYGSAWVSGLSISISLLWGVLISVFSAACISAYSILLSSFATNVRTSLLFFLGSVLLFGGIQIAHEYLSGLPSTDITATIAYLRQVVVFLNSIVAVIFPLSYLTRGMEAVEVGNSPSYMLLLLSTTIYTTVLLIFAIRTLKWKGVRKI